MRLCPECRNVIPDHLLGCLLCMKRKSDEAMRRYQVEALRHLMRDRATLITWAHKNVRHIRMFGAEMTFCGQDTPGGKRGYIDPQLDDLTGCCPRCREELDRAMKEATVAP